ncbi:DoxX family protein [Flavobacterium stagni]|uniref:DoxX family protein n=1 Tax=Flavobacterium stagni TaxID=2506421 RepID=A0A4Q1K9J8_9FLAO|nr:DoxX family protein [Flavobacterium stagni]RXR22538.1 DoxX family protein [Flavobacterium stagni]
MEQPWHLYVMSLVYIVAGINHFRNPKLYYKIIPPFFSNKKFINEMTGFLEILLGICLCISGFTNIAALSIIVLLVVIFPANIYMAIYKEARLGLPVWLLYLRLPLQFVLMIWAYYYIDFSQPLL